MSKMLEFNSKYFKIFLILILSALIFCLGYRSIELNETQLGQVNLSTKPIASLKSKPIMQLEKSESKSPEYFTDSFWKEILEISNEQKKMSPAILFKTLKFMLKETDHNDPQLIAFVRSLIHEPSKEKLNLDDKSGLVDFSQSGQSSFIDNLLKSKRNGFLIEAGAYDGEFQSNSLFFETQRNYTGILIEPVPSIFEKLLTKNRKLHKINACIAKDKPSVQQFRVHGVFSGRDNQMTNAHKSVFGNNFEYFYAPCFSLHTILKAMNVNKVDFFSLDLEGGENDVLKSLDFDKVSITTLLIEHLNDPLRKPFIKETMDRKNYTLVKDVHDFFYLKNV